ncbi:FAD-dependent oxidoreductase [Corynebacterium poyangense]|uniref:FAD-dependent oxidoreductase n=1 Tax=Corynebacterium poyangense TaxID=2684405 RepID=A0A7H0SQJ6_9CORY|nr:FAD-dependent oxidoreductase [Corynebacterium poyangense]MBZ8178288.1 FAD-dependent oxidoreductase [Corynebacterium poyangense]QNQ90821.1 FAD-dependent oxidoreductase [Corynebacterium poyangense]
MTSSQKVDVIVVGSGAGGLAAAVSAAHQGLKVIVVEKEPVIGGATARSGGWAWTPGTFFARKDGIQEPSEQFQTYLKSVIGDNYQKENISSFLDAAPRMVDFFHHKTRLQFVPGTSIKDIYGDLPGAGNGHRSVGPKPVNAKQLPPGIQKILAPQYYETSFLGMGIMAGPDLMGFLAAARLRPRGLFHAARRVTHHVWDLIRYRRGCQLVNGTALVGRLAWSAWEQGVVFRTQSAVTRLISEDSRVTGVCLGTGEIIKAKYGVVLATGGFPADKTLVGKHFPKALSGQKHYTLAPDAACGDGLRLAESVGGYLRIDDYSSPAAWCPVSLVPYFNGKQGVFPHIMDRAKPGSIGVLSNGKRFVNEANGYHDYVSALINKTPKGEPVQSWQIADSQFVRRYPLGMAKPFPIPLTPYLRSGYLVKGKTIKELARKCGINPEVLANTIREFNENAKRGVDPEFGRGSTPFNRYGGDQENLPNPSLGAIEKAPFYAVRVVPGSFGTFAGIAANERGQVIKRDGEPIPGLFSAGNDRASIMSGYYPAGGTNLGPALTFGFLVGEFISEGRD